MSLSYEFDYSIRDSGEVFLAEVLDGLELAIAIIGRDGTVSVWNRTLASLTGVPAMALEGYRLDERFPDLDAAWFHDLTNEARLLGRSRRCTPAAGRRVLTALGVDAEVRLASCSVVRVGSYVANTDSICLSFQLAPTAP
ncbi:MAG: hypothetical protein RIM84_23085 [Alphaproteobacteria bacterium]